MSAATMSHSHAFAADSDVLGSPYSTCYAPFRLYSDDEEHGAPPFSFSLLPPSSPPPLHQPTAPLPRRLSTSLFRLSPTSACEPLYRQWSDVPPTPTTALFGAGALALSSSSPMPLSSSTPAIAVTYIASVASTSSPPSTPSTSTPTPYPTPAPTPTPSPHPASASSSSSSSLPVPSSLSGGVGGAGAGAGAGDRVSRKRRRQRECDIQRRQKENKGFDRLYTLLTAYHTKKQQQLVQPRQQQPQQQQPAAISDDEDGDGEFEDKEAAADRKMNKADILHHSAERIEQLERMLADLAGANHRRHSLQSSMFTHSSAAVMVVHVPSGYCVDVSQRYLDHTMMERSWTVGRRFWPPYTHLVAHPTYLLRPSHAHAPIASLHRRDRVLCRPGGQGGGLVETLQSAQCEASVQAMRRLFSGESDTIFAVWRNQLGDGRVWEKGVHSWVTEWEEQADGTRTPLYAIGLVSTSETVRVE